MPPTIGFYDLMPPALPTSTGFFLSESCLIPWKCLKETHTSTWKSRGFTRRLVWTMEAKDSWGIMPRHKIQKKMFFLKPFQCCGTLSMEGWNGFYVHWLRQIIPIHSCQEKTWFTVDDTWWHQIGQNVASTVGPYSTWHAAYLYMDSALF